MEYNFREAIDEARQFRNAAALCLFEDEQRLYLPHIKRAYFFPAAFNYSCGIEILIKSILLIEDNFQKGHNLETLFNHLKKETKEHVKDLSKTRKFRTFEYNLKQHSKIYYDWRYFFEHKEKNSSELDFYFLMHFFNALDKTIYDIYEDRFK